MVNGHGTELLHTNPVPLAPGERVILLCNWGCVLDVKQLFSTFIYTHVAKAKDDDELIALLIDPKSKGKKYAPLSFIPNIMCEYRDAVPEIELKLKDDNGYFRPGVHELPVNAVMQSTGKPVTSKQLENPFERVTHKSYYYRASTKPGNVVLLSELLERIRRRTGGGPFTLVAFSCREFYSKMTAPRKLRDLKK